MNNLAARRPLRQRMFLAWCGLIGFEVTCQIALKFAGERTGAFDFSANAFHLALTSAWIWAAIVCYVGAFLVWIPILRNTALSNAFPVTAIVYIGVMGASWLIFAEPIGWLKILGSAIILVGILVLGSRDDSPEPARRSSQAT